MEPLSKDPSSAVTVCCEVPGYDHVTLPPVSIVTVAGE